MQLAQTPQLFFINAAKYQEWQPNLLNLACLFCREIGLMALAFMKRAFGSAAGRRTPTAGIAIGIYTTQGDGIAALGAVISVVLQNNKWNERLVATLGTNYKCFTSCHTRISFLLRACHSPKGFLP